MTTPTIETKPVAEEFPQLWINNKSPLTILVFSALTDSLSGLVVVGADDDTVGTFNKSWNREKFTRLAGAHTITFECKGF